MRRSSMFLMFLGVVGLAGILSACSSGSPSASAGAGGASGSGSASASGTVTGFGSIFVNGKKFETENVEVRHDGIAERCTITANVNDRCGLKEGMTVKVSGSFSGSTHRASTIVQEDTLEGPITSKVQVDASNGTLAVLGQTVLVDDTTRFDNSSVPNKLHDLNANDVIEVSGFSKLNGDIVASFIEKKLVAPDCSAGCEIKGVVKLHSHNSGTGSGTFQIGGLTISYDGATVIDNNMPPPTGSNWSDQGIVVEVKGTLLVGTTLTATKIERENEGAGNAVDESEVEGFVTSVRGPGDFDIGTTRVQTNANTEFRGGAIDEIVVGAKLSAEGRFDGTTLVAKHLKFNESVRLEGNASVTGNALTLAGLSGVTITVNSQTELKDGGNTITLNDLHGNRVRVRGRVSGNSSVIATRIELRQMGASDKDVVLQGAVQDDPVVAPTVTVLGVSVDTSAITHFESVSGTSMVSDGFFAAIKVGSIVKFKGTINGAGTAVNWGEAELED